MLPSKLTHVVACLRNRLLLVVLNLSSVVRSGSIHQRSADVALSFLVFARSKNCVSVNVAVCPLRPERMVRADIHQIDVAAIFVLTNDRVGQCSFVEGVSSAADPHNPRFASKKRLDAIAARAYVVQQDICLLAPCVC